MAFDEGLAQRIRESLGRQPGLVEKKMFGGVGFILQGNMACGVNKDDLILRVGPQRYEELLADPEARPFDFTGRPMKGWLMIGPDGYESDDALTRWLNLGIDFALSLPPK